MFKLPTEEEIDLMEGLLNVASDSTRLKILCALLNGEVEPVEKSVSELVVEVGVSQSLVSHQLKVLKDADLVDFRKDKTRSFYYLKDEHVKQLLEVVYDHIREKM